MTKILLTTSETAARLGIAESTVRKWAPQWPGAQKLGRDWLIPESALGWWAEHDSTPGPKKAERPTGME